jgi:hypothetical protein
MPGPRHERAALIYQHEARGADRRITEAIDSHVQAERDQGDDADDGPAGALVPAGSWHANGTKDGLRLSGS